MLDLLRLYSEGEGSNSDGSSGDGGESVGTIILFSLGLLVGNSGLGTSETLDGLISLSAGSSTTSSLNPETGSLLDILAGFS